MKSRPFPGCCTASILYDFGGTILSQGEKGNIGAERIRNYLKKKAKDATGYDCLVVITNDKQKIANEILEDLGFEHSEWMSKIPHPESKIRLWWLPPKKRRV